MKPDNIPPTPRPIALPIFSKNLPPLSTSILAPGILLIAPRAANTVAVAATTAPKPTTPAKDAPTYAPSRAIAALNATIFNDTSTNLLRVFTVLSTFIPLSIYNAAISIPNINPSVITPAIAELAIYPAAANDSIIADNASVPVNSFCHGINANMVNADAIAYTVPAIVTIPINFGAESPASLAAPATANITNDNAATAGINLSNGINDNAMSGPVNKVTAKPKPTIEAKLPLLALIILAAPIIPSISIDNLVTLSA